mgnify:CR=1 FL=1
MARSFSNEQLAGLFGQDRPASDPFDPTRGPSALVEYLKKLLASGQGGKDLENMLAGLEGGFGNINAHIEAPGSNRAPNAAPPFDSFGQSSEKRIPIGPAGTLVVNPTAGLGTIGQGIMSALKQPKSDPQGAAERDDLMRMIMKMRKKDKSLSQWNDVLGRI